MLGKKVDDDSNDVASISCGKSKPCSCRVAIRKSRFVRVVYTAGFASWAVAALRGWVRRPHPSRSNAGIVASRIDPSSKLGLPVKAQSQRITLLVGIKLLPTAVWLFFAECMGGVRLCGSDTPVRRFGVLGTSLCHCGNQEQHQQRRTGVSDPHGHEPIPNIDNLCYRR